jgi:predicted DNA-binding transcriptional regulator AlpA
MAHHFNNSALPDRRVTARGLDTALTPSLASAPATLPVASGSCSTKAATCTPPLDPVLRLPEVLEAVRVGRTTLLKMVKNGEFPAPLHLTARIRVWRLSAVQQFLASVEGE